MNTNRFHKPRIARMTRVRLRVRGHVRAFKAATRRRTPKRPRRNYLIPPRRARSTRSLEIRRLRRFPQIQIYESGKKEIRKWGRGFETCSAPALTRCYPRSFAFYLGNPFPPFCVPALTHVLPPIRPLGFPIYVARRPAAPFTRLNCPCPICVDPWLAFLRVKKAAGIFLLAR